MNNSWPLLTAISARNPWPRYSFPETSENIQINGGCGNSEPNGCGLAALMGNSKGDRGDQSRDDETVPVTELTERVHWRFKVQEMRREPLSRIVGPLQRTRTPVANQWPISRAVVHSGCSLTAADSCQLSQHVPCTLLMHKAATN